MPINVALTAQVVLEILRLAKELREVFGDDVTDEQLADALSRSVVRFDSAAKLWDDAKQAHG